MTHRTDTNTQFLQFPRTLQEEFRSHMLEKKFRRGEIISDEILLHGYSFIIIKGMARGFYIRRGHEHTFSFAFDGDLLNVPESLFRLPGTTPAIEILETADILLMPRREVPAILRSADAETVKALLEIVFGDLFVHVQNIEEQRLMFQSMNARERYEWFVSRYPEILDRATITQIASFLGVTKETLYRIRAGKYGRATSAQPQKPTNDEQQR